MYLSARDRAILAFVARFEQATARQIREVVFGSISQTPCDRALLRLRELGLLTRVEHRRIGGAKGGSGQYVYMLSGNGRKLFGMEGKSRAGAINFHSIAIADCFVVLKQLERAGVITVVSYETEPDCWLHLGGMEVRTDLAVDVRRGLSEPSRLVLEVDLGTEWPKQLRTKLEAYYRAWQHADESVGHMPGVLWVTMDEERARELEHLVAAMPDEARGLFRVTTLERLPEMFS